MWERLGNVRRFFELMACGALAMNGVVFAQAASQPLVIAHRGASGYLPEHTLPAYALAHGQGADYVEPDLVRTRDGVFICLHDIHLESTTDVEQAFPERRRSDGRWYAADFDLSEIRTLRVHERLEGRFPLNRSSFSVPTFEEMLELIQGMNESTGRQVGVYPELKAPDWHRSEGLEMESAFLEIASRYDLGGKGPAVFVQSFEAGALRRLRELGSKLPHIMLMGGPFPADDAKSGALLDEIATYADGIGPAKTLLTREPRIVNWAHERGLQVHPYTFRVDDLGDGVSSFEEELEQFYSALGVDGLFTDFPDRARLWLDSRP